MYLVVCHGVVALLKSSQQPILRLPWLQIGRKFMEMHLRKSAMD
jgi:hypothetical protein